MTSDSSSNRLTRLAARAQHTTTAAFTALPRPLRSVIRLAHRTWQEFGQDHGMTLATSLAYTGMFSFFPLLLTIISLLSLFLGSTLPNGMSIEDYVLSWVASTIPGAAETVRTVLAEVQAERGSLPVWSSLFLIIGASALFGQLQYGLDLIFDCWPRRRNPLQMLLARAINAAFVLGIVALLFVAVIVEAIVTVLRTLPFLPADAALPSQFTTPLITFVITALAFALLMTLLPERRPRFWDVLPAAVIGAVFWGIGKTILTWYLGRPFYNLVYGSLAWLFLLMLWFYYAALVFLLTAELAATSIKMRQAAAEIAERGASDDTPRASTPTV